LLPPCRDGRQALLVERLPKFAEHRAKPRDLHRQALHALARRVELDGKGIGKGHFWRSPAGQDVALELECLGHPLDQGGACAFEVVSNGRAAPPQALLAAARAVL